MIYDDHDTLGPEYFDIYRTLRAAGKIGRVWPEGHLWRVGPVHETERVLGPSTYTLADQMTVGTLKELLDGLNGTVKKPAASERWGRWSNPYRREA